MAWRIYKEGQGKWLRGALAFLVGVGAIWGVLSLHRRLGSWPFTVPGLDWKLDVRHFIEAPILVLVLGWGVWLYNRPKVVDFLIDTEHELKNRVTWPSRKEEINASVVVVITVVIMMICIFAVDAGLSELKDWVFHPPKER